MKDNPGQIQSLEKPVNNLGWFTAHIGSNLSALRRLPALFLSLSPLAALFLWVFALQGADPARMNDLGLATVLPPAALGALLLLVFSFSLTLGQEKLHSLVLLLHVLALIFTLYGAAILIEGLPRTSIAWRLVGIIDHVMSDGSVVMTRDAFQNWPGFYILVGFLTTVAGMESPLILAAWAHVLFNLLYLGPLLLLFRTVTQDKRLVWLGVWFFYLNNWIGQDYLAPQAFGYLIYLVTLGILLNWFQTGAVVGATRCARVAPTTRGGQLAGLMAMVLVFMVVLTPSHQLTPVALLASVTVLVLFRRIAPRGLPLILGMLIIAWLSYLAVPFLSGHLNLFTQPLGSLGSNINENVLARVNGSPEHVFIVLLRILMTLGVCVLAGLGVMRRLRNGYVDLNFILLALIPFPLLAFQTYGGELLLRTYLFALPFVSFFMAALFWPQLSAWLSPRLMLIVFGLSAILGAAFFLTRYGNERMDYFRPGELEAVEYVYAVAEPGSQLIAGTPMVAWRFKDYNLHTYAVVNKLIRSGNINQLIAQMSDEQYPESYLILTRSQQAAAELLYGWPPGTWERFEALLAASNKFEIVFENAEARVYRLAS